MIIPANISYGLSANFADSGLFAGMKIFNTSTGAPVQITGLPGMVNNILPMTNVGVSNTYAAQFTGVNGNTYLFQFDVYTDGTYTAVDPAYPEQSKTAYASFLKPVFIEGLQMIVGCENQPRQRPVVAAQNSDCNILLTFMSECGQIIDMTGITGNVVLSFLEIDELTTLAKNAVLVNGTINQFLVSLSAADLALLPPGENDAATSFTLAGVNSVLNIYDAIRVNPAIV